MPTTIDLDPDAPHSPDRTRQLADVAAEAIRTLNYATASDDDRGLIYPGDAYELLGAVRTLTRRLPQLCTQIGDYLERADGAGRLEETADGPHHGQASRAVADAVGALRRAIGDAETMTEALGNAQSAIQAVRYAGPDRDDDTEA